MLDSVTLDNFDELAQALFVEKINDCFLGIFTKDAEQLK